MVNGLPTFATIRPSSVHLKQTCDMQECYHAWAMEVMFLIQEFHPQRLHCASAMDSTAQGRCQTMHRQLNDHYEPSLRTLREVHEPARFLEEGRRGLRLAG